MTEEFHGFVYWRERLVACGHFCACLWIMKGNLPMDQMKYSHNFNETNEMTWEVDAAFHNFVFCVAPAILDGQLRESVSVLRQLNDLWLRAMLLWWGTSRHKSPVGNRNRSE